MSAVWRSHFTFNKYSQIAARAFRQSLKEGERLKAEKRGITAMRYQHWENGKAGELTHLNPPAQPQKPTKSAAV